MASIWIDAQGSEPKAYIDETVRIANWYFKAVKLYTDIEEKIAEQYKVKITLPHPCDYVLEEFLKKKIKHYKFDLTSKTLYIGFRIPLSKIRKFKKWDAKADVYKWLDEGLEKWKKDVFKKVKKLQKAKEG